MLYLAFRIWCSAFMKSLMSWKPISLDGQSRQMVIW